MAETTVLVTGGAGYIGSHAVLALRARGYPVVVLDDLSTGRRDLVPPDVPLVVGDVGDAELLRAVSAEHRPSAVMHFAGSIVVPDSVSDPLAYYHNNTVKTRELLAWAVQARLRAFVFSSTASVYGDREDRPVSEGAPLAPTNPYAWSKLMSERMLLDSAQAYALPVAILRYFNVAGADPEGRSGQCFPRATHLIKVAVEAALGRREAVYVNGRDYPTPDGTGVRDYVHVSDLAQAHVQVLDALQDQPGRSLIYNVGYGVGHSVLEVLDAVDRASGGRLVRRDAPRRPGDVAALVADSGALQRDLGWTPRYAQLDTVVAHALAWERRLAPPEGC